MAICSLNFYGGSRYVARNILGGASKTSISPGNICHFRPLSLILMALMLFFTKSIIAKQFEGSQIMHMCIFHVLRVRGLPGSKGASVPCMGLPGNAEAPLVTRLGRYILYSSHYSCVNLSRTNIRIWTCSSSSIVRPFAVKFSQKIVHCKYRVKY